MTETKQEKFDRMLEARLPKAIKAIELLANLSRKGDYEWHGSQIDDMLNQIEEAVDGVMDAFGVGEGVEPVVDTPTAAPYVYEGVKTPLPEVKWSAPVDDVHASAPAVAKEMGALADLSTQQLVDRMIACGAELAARRK